MAPKVLFVLTSHNKLGDTGKGTGWYLPEFAHPYEVLAHHVTVDVASPLGGTAPIDEGSVEAFKEDAVSVKFLEKKLWENTQKLSSFLGRAKEYEAIFFVGGHGPMWDLAVDPVSHELINEFYASNKIITAVCHGPGALINVKLPSGEYLIAGQAVTGFSNSEESAVGLTAVVPFSLETKLNENSGGKFIKGDDWKSKVVVSSGGRLITGQNPQSAYGTAQATYDAIFGAETTKDES